MVQFIVSASRYHPIMAYAGSNDAKMKLAGVPFLQNLGFFGPKIAFLLLISKVLLIGG